MDKTEVLDLYRGRNDIVQPGQAAHDYWYKHYHYAMGRGSIPLGYWVADEEEDDEHPTLAITEPPDFDITTFLVPRGDGEPACHCYRCPTMLTLDTLLIDSPRAGLYRPICEECRAEIDRET